MLASFPGHSQKEWPGNEARHLPGCTHSWFQMTFCAVVIWRDLLRDLQHCQDTLSWHPPNNFECSAGEWREAHKDK